MKKTTLLLFAFLLAISALSLSFIKRPSLGKKLASATTKTSDSLVVKLSEAHDHATGVRTLTSTLYKTLSLEEKGLSKNALEVAIKGYLTLKEQGALTNPDLLTIVDFSQSSRKKRFYLLDVKAGKLLQNTFVAHGKNSGVDRATDFSNTIGSEKSSLGFFVTKETYTGKHGLSLRMAGLEKGFNDNAEARAIVVHGADYVNAGRVQSAYMGRSQGCPAVPMAHYKKIINQIKDGSALFIYYPDVNYLNDSQLLNI